MPYDPNEEVSYRLLTHSDEYVTRDGTDIPAWFDMELNKEGWPTQIVLSVLVDVDEGPIINGIRAGRNYRRSYQDVIKFFRENTDPAVFLRFVTAYAAGALATKRVLEPHYGEMRINEETTEAIGKIRDLYARRAWPATETRRRRRVTRDLLTQVAAMYRKAHEDGKPPTQAVAEAFEVSHSTAGRWVVEARKAGVLGPAAGPKAGEASGSPSDVD